MFGWRSNAQRGPRAAGSEAQDAQQALARLQRVTAFYAALSRTNHAIVRAADRLALCREICRICVDTGHATMAYIGFVEGERFTALAYAGPEPETLADFRIYVGPGAPQSGAPIATAVREGRVVVCEDFQHDPRTAKWHALAARLGIASSIAAPVTESGQVRGALSLYMGTPAFFDAETARLVEEMAQDLSFALDTLQREQERQRARERRHAEHERFRRVFAAMPGYTSITDLATGAIVEVNAIVCRAYGFAREEMIGHTWVELGVGMPHEDRVRLYDKLTRDGSISDFATRVRLRGGEWREVLVYGERIEFGGHDCVLAVATDVTERKALEAAEAASRAKTEFLSRMSHELRTPLNAVLGFTELMLHDGGEPPSPAQRQRLAIVRDAGWHLLKLIDDVLDVSHVEAGKVAVDIKPVAVAPLLDAVVALTETTAQGAGVAIEARYREAPPLAVRSDVLRLRQILVNLVTNAVKYNRPGGWVRLDALREGEQVLIRVADNGIGMSEQQRAGLFEPFNRLGRERLGIQGSGIGLALSRRLAELLGAQIRVDSEVDRGTCMTVALPAADLPAPTAHGELPEALRGDLRGSVLYIEDEPVNVLLVAELLAHWPGIAFRAAASGAEGLAAIRADPPDLVLLDMQLPDMSGLSVLRALAAQPGERRVPVIGLSASAMPEDVQQALRAGAVEYWTKPLDFPAFAQGMERLMPDGRDGREPGAPAGP